MTSRMAVFASTPDGGHPEYVAKLLSGVLSAAESLEVVWPVRSDRSSLSDDDPRIIFERGVIPSMPPRDGLSRWRWLVSRINPMRRHDVGELRWLYSQDKRFDVVLIQEVQRFTLPLVVFLALRKADRVILHLHNVRRHDYRGSLFDRLDEVLLRIGLRICSAVVVHSEKNRAFLVNQHGVRERVFVVPHGITPAVETVRPAPTPPVILFFGVNRKNKGLAVLVDAIRQMDADVELHVAGFTGPAEWNETTQLLSSLPNVIWKHEFIDNADVPEWFKRATVVALPYTTFEAQSGVMHLAMEYGVPIVASDVGGLGETIRAWEIGIAVAPNDPKALADALSVGVSEPLNLGFRENILKSHVHLDWDTIGERFGSILLHSGTADG